MRLAFLSDIHSNLPALEAVLDDIASTGVDARYVLGDLVGYAPWPNEVLERLQVEGIPTVMGNYDEGTGFDADECGCAYTDPTEKALGDASLRVDQGACQRGQQGVAARGSRLYEPHRGRSLSDDQAGTTPDSGGPHVGGGGPSLPAVWTGDGGHRGGHDHRSVGRSQMMAFRR